MWSHTILRAEFFECSLDHRRLAPAITGAVVAEAAGEGFMAAASLKRGGKLRAHGGAGDCDRAIFQGLSQTSTLCGELRNS